MHTVLTVAEDIIPEFEMQHLPRAAVWTESGLGLRLYTGHFDRPGASPALRALISLSVNSSGLGRKGRNIRDCNMRMVGYPVWVAFKRTGPGGVRFVVRSHKCIVTVNKIFLAA